MEEKGVCYLFMKTPERAHMPNQMWEKVKLSKNYKQALETIDKELEFWSKFQSHKCKQRLTKLFQMIIRKRKMKLTNQQEILVPIRKKFEKREMKREAKAEKAAQLENAIEKEIIHRLKEGTYKDIYNIHQKEFENVLDDEEVSEIEYEEEEESEDELEDEREFVAEGPEEEVDDIEDLEDLGIGAKRRPNVTIEYERELESYNTHDTMRQK